MGSTSRLGRRHTVTSTSSQNPALGSVSITDADAVRPGGSSWTVNGSVTAGAVPEAGRVLLGTVNVVTSAGATVGRGDVIVLNVTP